MKEKSDISFPILSDIFFGIIFGDDTLGTGTTDPTDLAIVENIYNLIR